MDKVLVTVNNGYGTASEIVTVNYLDLLAPVFKPATVTLNCKQNVDVNWLPTGSHLVLGSGDRIRHVEWTARDLPDGISLDTKIGRLTGKISVCGNYESYLTVSTNCGIATCKLLWIVSPLQVATISNPFSQRVSFGKKASQHTYIYIYMAC